MAHNKLGLPPSSTSSPPPPLLPLISQDNVSSTIGQLLLNLPANNPMGTTESKSKPKTIKKKKPLKSKATPLLNPQEIWERNVTKAFGSRSLALSKKLGPFGSYRGSNSTTSMPVPQFLGVKASPQNSTSNKRTRTNNNKVISGSGAGAYPTPGESKDFLSANPSTQLPFNESSSSTLLDKNNNAVVNKIKKNMKKKVKKPIVLENKSVQNVLEQKDKGTCTNSTVVTVIRQVKEQEGIPEGGGPVVVNNSNEVNHNNNEGESSTVLLKDENETKNPQESYCEPEEPQSSEPTKSPSASTPSLLMPTATTPTETGTATPRPTPPPLNSSKMDPSVYLSLIQTYMNNLTYHRQGEPETKINIRLSIKQLMVTAKKLISLGKPIKCLHALVLGIYFTNHLSCVERFPVHFKSTINGKDYKHVVLAIYFRGCYGALGISRDVGLQDKPPIYPRLAELINDYYQSYHKSQHVLKEVKIGSIVTHNPHSMEQISWKLGKVGFNLEPEVIEAEIEKVGRKLKTQMGTSCLKSFGMLRPRSLMVTKTLVSLPPLPKSVDEAEQGKKKSLRSLPVKKKKKVVIEGEDVKGIL